MSSGGVWTIERESPFASGIADLIAASDAFMTALYPAESNHAIDLNELAHPTMRLFIARRNGEALGSIAYRVGREWVEIKRLYVHDAARGAGLGRRLIVHLLEAIAAEQIDWVRLETGIYNDAALKLYESLGFQRIGPFEPYGPDPYSVFMELDRRPRELTF